MSKRLCSAARILAGAALVLALSGTGVADSSNTEVLAEIDGTAITADEIEKSLGAPYRKLQEQLYGMKRQKLRAMIADRLLAAEAVRRGVSVAQLLAAEVTQSIGVVTDEEVEKFYADNHARLDQGDDAAGREQSRSMLEAQRRSTARETYIKTLESRSHVVVHLKPPAIERVHVPAHGGIRRGAESGAVTVVEFTDFHCPFCRRTQPTIAEVLARFGDKVTHVHRDFPIARIHPQAPRAHVAARCADEQGRFWQYHAKLYAGPPKSTMEQLRTYARDAGLDVAVFEQCLRTSRYEAAVEADIEEGKRLGVPGTPTYFINGRRLVGAHPVTKFVEFIEDELARQP
jgi:protein-disulfide isomerase